MAKKWDVVVTRVAYVDCIYEGVEAETAEEAEDKVLENLDELHCLHPGYRVMIDAPIFMGFHKDVEIKPCICEDNETVLSEEQL